MHKYENTLDLNKFQQVSAANGLRGDNMAAFAGGGAGGLLTNLIYKGLDGIGRGVQKLRKRYEARSGRHPAVPFPTP